MPLQQATRIPITAPSTPYNTLVYIGGTLDWTEGVQIPMGKLDHVTIRANTRFRPIGYDPRNPPQFEHSTTAWVRSIGPQKNCMFQVALNSIVDAALDPDDLGLFYVKVDIGFMSDKGLGENCLQMSIEPGSDPPVEVCTLYWIPFEVEISSYILIYETPPEHRSTGQRGGFDKPEHAKYLQAAARESQTTQTPSRATRTPARSRFPAFTIGR